MKVARVKLSYLPNTMREPNKSTQVIVHKYVYGITALVIVTCTRPLYCAHFCLTTGYSLIGTVFEICDQEMLEVLCLVW